MTFELVVSAAILLCLLYAAVGGFRTPPPPAQPATMRDLVVGAALIVGGFFLFGWGPWWGGGLAVLGVIGVVGTLAEMFDRAGGQSGWKSAIRWLAAGALAVMLWTTVGNRVERGRREAALKARAAEQSQAAHAAADLIRRTRPAWQLQEGVTEVQSGPLLAWLSVPPRIAIDWSFEQELGAAADRQISVRATLFNESFEQMALEPTADPMWRVDVLAPGGNVLAAWTDTPQREGGSFVPAERRDYVVVWNGRLRDGQLAPPGTYRARLTTWVPAGAAGPLTAESPFELADEGPVVENAGPDPVRAWQRSIEQMLEFDRRNAEIFRVQQMQREMDSFFRGLR